MSVKHYTAMTPKMPVKEKVGFAAFSASNNIVYQFKSLYYMFFLTNVLGISIGAECQSNLDSEKRGSFSLIWQVGCSVYYDTTCINLCNLSAILFVTRERLLGIGLLLGGFYVKTQTSDDGGSSKDHAKA